MVYISYVQQTDTFIAHSSVFYSDIRVCLSLKTELIASVFHNLLTLNKEHREIDL